MKKQLVKVMMIAGVVACSVLTASGYAQKAGHTPEEKAKRMTDSLKSNLALTDSQYSKIYELNVNYITKMQALRKQDGSKEDKKQSFKELRKSQHKNLSAVLTKDQMEKLRVMQKQKRGERNEHHHEAKESSPS